MMKSSSTNKIFYVEASRKNFDAELINLIRDGDYDEVRSIIKGIHEENLIDSDGTHLLHIAAKYNNIQLINYFLEAGCEPNVENWTKMTPLLFAVVYENYEAAKILYNAHLDLKFGKLDLQDIQGEEFKYIRECKRRYVEFPLLNDLISEMQIRQLSSERIGTALAKVTNCQLIDVLQLRDPVTTKVFLQLSPNVVEISYVVARTGAFNFVLRTFDLQHILILLHYKGFEDYEKWITFSGCLIHNFVRFHKTKTGRSFLKRIFSWDVFTEESLRAFEYVLQRSNIECVRIFLKYNFHVMAKAKYNRDLLICLFGNQDTRIISLLTDEQIDVHGRSYNGNNTPLHFAGKFYSIEIMRKLLDKGANPNALNDKQMTPLQKCFASGNEKKIELLLLSGANILLVNDQFQLDGYSYSHLSNMYNPCIENIVTLLVAQIAICETLGQGAIDQMIQNLMKWLSPDLENFLHLCRLQLNELKTHDIRKNTNATQKSGKKGLTIFTILAERPKNVALYIKREELQAVFEFLETREETLISYYRDLLKKHTEDIAKIYPPIHHCKNIAVSMVCQITGIHDPYNLIIEKIVSYLDLEDLLKFEMKSTNRRNSFRRIEAKLRLKLNKIRISKF